MHNTNIAFTVALLLTPLAVLNAADAPQGRPNILFILTDQQHAGMLSCAGNRHLKTPTLDSLAATGTRFELAYCANPVCMPSRFSMMTGVLPSRVGVETNGKGRAKVTPDILENSLGRVFGKAGYQTVYGGKVHVPMKLEELGFANIEGNGGPKLAEACAKFLHQPHDRPFLMVASFINPHDICFMAISDAQHPGKITGPNPLLEALAAPLGISRDELARLCPPLPANHEIPAGEPEAILAADTRAFRTHARNDWTPEQWRLHRWAYARLTERVDTEIGRVLTALRETGLEKYTVVVFSSDHGDMDSAHRLEHKSVLYEEAARVPLIVSWKGVTKPGLVDRKSLVSTGLDLIPTLCDFAGIPIPAALKGRSVRALAEGITPPSWRETQVVENGESRMLRSARYKYIVYASGARREMLVDMVADPGEMKNLAMDRAFASVLDEHRRLLKEWYHLDGESLDSKYVVSGAE